MRVHLGLDLSASPLEITIIDALDSVFPDQVAGLVPQRAQRGEVAVADLPQIPQQMSGGGAVRIGSHRLHLDEHAGQIHPILFQRSDSFLGHVAAQSHRLERPVPGCLEFGNDLRNGHPEPARYPGKNLIWTLQLCGQDRHGKSGTVQDERPPLSVLNQPPRCGDARDPQTVLFGEPQEVLTLDHLNLPQADGQDQQEAGDDRQQHGQTAFKELSVHRSRPVSLEEGDQTRGAGP